MCSNLLKGQRSSKDIKDAKSNEYIIKKGRVFTKKVIQKLESAKVELIPISEIGHLLAFFTTSSPSSRASVLRSQRSSLRFG